MKKNEFLIEKPISVIVLAYQSSQTIEETLKSIYNQTYQNIELVVTDDGSTDDTVTIVKQWTEKNELRFCRTILVDSSVNTGTSKSLNRAVKACSGEWIKIIAADDLLLPECIEKFVDLVCEDAGEIKIYQSDEEVINDKGEIIGYMENERLRMQKVAQMENVEEQYRYFLHNDVKVSPTLFFSKKTFTEIGECDERIRNIEDYPLKLRFLRNGYRMGYLKCSTVQYRIHESVSHRIDEVCPMVHMMQRRKMKEFCCYPYVSKSDLNYWTSEWLERFQEDVIVKLFRNRPSTAVYAFIKVMSYLIPRQWERRLVEWKKRNSR